MNEEESMVKKSLVLTGKLVGAFAVWVALLSFLAVIVTGRVMLTLSAGSGNAVDKTPAAADAPWHRPSPSSPQSAKPNG